MGHLTGDIIPGPDDEDETGCGWQWLGVLPHVLEKILREGDFDREATIRTWKERGWVATDEGRTVKSTRIGTEVVRVIAITRDAIENVANA